MSALCNTEIYGKIKDVYTKVLFQRVLKGGKVLKVIQGAQGGEQFYLYTIYTCRKRELTLSKNNLITNVTPQSRTRYAKAT